MTLRPDTLKSSLLPLIVILILVTPTTRLSSRQTSAPAILINGGTLIDGTGRPPIHNAAVLVERGRITAAGPRNALQPPPGTQSIDATGKFILPGLIDNHVHFRDWHGELYLAHGVTTVKDLGNPIEWLMTLAADQRAGKLRAPRIYYVGNVIDAPPPTTDHFLAPDSPEQARAFVRKLRDHGAIAIKVHHQITPELLTAIADEAHRMNMPVTGHLGVMGAREAALAGIDGLDHGIGIGHTLGTDEKQPGESLVGFEAFRVEMDKFRRMDPKKYGELIRLLVNRGVAVLPTFINFWRVATDQADAFAREDAEFAEKQELRYLPQDVRQILLTSDRYRARSPEELARFRIGYEKMLDFLRQFRRAGGRIPPGSSTVEMIPGLSFIRELELMRQIGFSNHELIVAATRGNAEFMRIAYELGTIEAGKLADIIIVSRNPLEDIRNLRSVEQVMIGGVLQDLRLRANYSIPTPRPKLTRPLWIERQLEDERSGGGSSRD